MLKKNLKRLLALVAVFAMAITLITVPNASAKADEANGKITFANGYDWSLGVDNIYVFASEDSTVADITGQGEGFMAWFQAVILEANEDGTYTVAAPVDFAINNGAETVALEEGVVVLMAHSTVVNYVDSYNWLCSLAEGDVVSMDITWADLAAAAGAVDVNIAEGAGLVPEEPVEPECTHEGLVHMEAVEAGCHMNGNIEYWVCYDCETVWADEALTQITNIKNVVVPATGGEVVAHEAVEPACHYTGNIAYWTCAECEGVWADEALTQLTNIKNVVLPAVGGEVVHVEAVEPTATENGNIEYWYCEDCEQVWQDEALTQLTNFKNVILPATGEEEPAFEADVTATFANGYDWTNGVNNLYVFAAESSTIAEITGQGEGFMAWWPAAILEANEDGTYTVVAPVDFAINNGAETVALEEGVVVLMAHSTTSYVDGYNWLCALTEGDVVAMDTAWADIAAAAGAVEVGLAIAEVEGACAHDGLVHMDAVEPGCHYDGNIEYWVCYDCETVWQDEALTQITNIKNVVLPATGSENLVYFPAVDPGCHYDGCIEYWYCPDCDQVWQDEALTQLTNHKNVVVPAVGGEVIHVEAVAPTATEDGNIEYWYCEDCETVWQDEALTQITNFKNVILPATGEEEPALPSIEVVATATFANGYDWTAQVNQIYIYASANAEDTISGFTGQDAGTFGWFHAVILEANGDGTYTVVSSDFATNNGAESVALGEGKVILMAHSTTSYVDSFNALSALVAGDVVALDTAWADVAAKFAEVVEVSLGFVKEEEPPVVDPELPCEHEGLVHMEAVEPGCHYEGNIEYWVCYDCETVWADEDLTQITNIKNVVLPEAGGEVIHVEAVEPGCENEGNIEYWYCEECEQVWQDEARTQLTNFKNVNLPAIHGNLVHMEAVEPGCHYEGHIEHWVCYDCETVWSDAALTQITNHKNVVIPELGGEVIHVEAKAPTAKENGNIEYWYCEDCEQVWQDEARTQLTNFKNVILPATGEAPVTGDSAPIVVYVVTLMVAAAAVVVALKKRFA